MTKSTGRFANWRITSLPVEPGEPKVQLGASVLRGLFLLYFMSSLAAYNVGPIPITWMGQAGFIALAIGLILYVNKVRIVPGAGWLLFFIFWAFVLNTLNAGEFSTMMPPRATLPYALYIAVRYINILSFASAFYLTYWLLKSGYQKELVRMIIIVGLIASAGAGYVYLAQILGLPELPRTRLGTSGGAQATTFSSGMFSYRRALGTFREPSHLAEWLMLPFFLSFLRRDRLGKWGRIAIGGTIMLTVSLTAFFSVALGTGLSMLLTNPFNRKYMRLLGLAVIIGGVLFVVLQNIVVGSGLDGSTLAAVVTGRIGTTIGGGFGKTDRAYVYELMAEHPLPALGYGFGNGNLYGSALTQNDAVMSFLSLYVNTLYATGFLGFAVLLIFIFRPVVQYLRSRARRQGIEVPVILMTYFSYLVAFGVTSEELSTPFALTAAMLTYQAAILAQRYRASVQMKSAKPVVARLHAT